jgi:alpha-tubulin suppressor-like RCC1 family protein
LAAIRTKARLADVRAFVPATIATGLLCLFFSASAQASGATAMGWGFNPAGQVGNGTATPQAGDRCECIRTPVPVKGLSGVTEIANGADHSLALLANGTVMAWGLSNRGQLGDGEDSGPEQCKEGACSTSPLPVPNLAGVVAVVAGFDHSLALLANGTVMAWGPNSLGQLGDGDSSGPQQCDTNIPCSKTPVPVPGLDHVVAIATGGQFNLALLANGTVMAWGFDSRGQVGDGVGILSGCGCVTRPTPVPGVSGAMAISAGDQAAYALLADGRVEAWGQNVFGQLGIGTTSPETGCECLGPVSVGGLAGARAVYGGGASGLALLASGSVQAWGLNDVGQLGNGGKGEAGCFCVPTPASVNGLAGPQAIAAGHEHGLALLPSGSVEAWGGGTAGQLGDGTAEGRVVPTPISGIGGASGVFTGAEDSFATIGPSQTLKVSMAGAGTGTVGTRGIVCPPSCEGRYPQSQVEILRAEPSPGSGFAGFSGPCSGAAPCMVKLDADQGVTATFGPPKGTAITKAKISSRKKSAFFSFSAPGAITGFECELIRPRPKHRRGHRHLERAGKKKPRPHFSRCLVPKHFKHLAPGRYTFEVRALDILGADATPAKRHFKVKPGKHRRPTR